MVQPIEVICPEFAVVGSLGQHMISRPQDLVCDRDRCAHLAASGSETAIFRREVAVARFARGNRRGDHGSLEPDVSLACFSAPLPARALVIGGAETRPG